MCVFESSRIPRDIIEEALNLRISDENYAEICKAVKAPAPLSVEIPPALIVTRQTVGNVNAQSGGATGLNAIMSAAQRLESGEGSSSLRLPSITMTTPSQVDTLHI